MHVPAEFLNSLLSALISVPIAFADSTILPGVPGPLDPSSSGGALAFIQNGYLFALGIAGVLAVGSIVWGGIQYTLSRGNPAQLSDAWDRIVQAFIGILLLVGAGTILTIVNPGLTSLELPDLQTVDEAKYGANGLSLEPGQLNAAQIRELDETQPGWRKPTGSGKCVDGAGTECAQDRMSAACPQWDPAKASKVCMVESGGGNPLAKSSSDKCADGKSFSFGLLQINIADHATNPRVARLLPESCKNLFSPGGKGSCLDCRKGGSGPTCKRGVCFKWSCRMIGTEERYEQCRREIGGQQGLKIACYLYNAAPPNKKWQPWAWTAGQVCKIGLGP